MASKFSSLETLGLTKWLTTDLKRIRAEARQRRSEPPFWDVTKEEDSFDAAHNLLESPMSIKGMLPPEWVDYYDRILENNRKIEKLMKSLDIVI
jgi:hypothetical protein